MKLKLMSIGDIRSLKPIYYIGSFLGILPNYNFTNSIENYCTGRAIKAVIIGSAMAAAIAYNAQTFVSEAPGYVPAVNLFLYIMNDVATLLKVLAALLTGVLYQEKWKIFNNNFQLIDARLKNRNKRGTNLFKNVTFQCILAHAIFLSINFYVYFLLTLTDDYANFSSYTITDVIRTGAKVIYALCRYYSFFIELMIFFIVRTFKSRYHDLNALIQNKPAQLAANDLVATARTLNASILSFNGLFGWILMMMIGECVVMLLDSLNFFISETDISSSLGVGVALEVAIDLVTSLALSILVIMTCDATKIEKEKTYFLCRKVKNFKLEAFESIMEELNDTNFTAADFFEIDRTTLLGILATTTTYFIVVIQFNKEIKVN